MELTTYQCGDEITGPGIVVVALMLIAFYWGLYLAGWAWEEWRRRRRQREWDERLFK